MFSQRFIRSTAVWRNSAGYLPFRFMVTRSSFPCKVCQLRVSHFKGSVQKKITRTVVCSSSSVLPLARSCHDETTRVRASRGTRKRAERSRNRCRLRSRSYAKASVGSISPPRRAVHSFIVAPRIENEVVSCPCAMWASEWRFELANLLAPLRERNFQTDTIPKPGGLVSGGSQSGLAVQLSIQDLSSFCPGFVQLWSSLFRG